MRSPAPTADAEAAKGITSAAKSIEATLRIGARLKSRGLVTFGVKLSLPISLKKS